MFCCSKFALHTSFWWLPKLYLLTLLLWWDTLHSNAIRGMPNASYQPSLRSPHQRVLEMPSHDLQSDHIPGFPSDEEKSAVLLHSAPQSSPAPPGARLSLPSKPVASNQDIRPRPRSSVHLLRLPIPRALSVTLSDTALCQKSTPRGLMQHPVALRSSSTLTRPKPFPPSVWCPSISDLASFP